MTKISTSSSGLWVRILGFVGAWFLRLLNATWHVDGEGLERLDRLSDEGGHALATFWHGKYIPLFTLLRGRRACVFTSQSFRGQVISEICRQFGYDCVQLPRHGGVRPLELMRRTLTSYRFGGIAVDGPLGPYHVVKPGAIELASSLGFVLLPVSTASRRRRIFLQRWDQMELPWFFTQVALVIGEPLYIPPDLNNQDLPFWESQLHQSLIDVDRRANELVSAL